MSTGGIVVIIMCVLVGVLGLCLLLLLFIRPRAEKNASSNPQKSNQTNSDLKTDKPAHQQQSSPRTSTTTEMHPKPKKTPDPRVPVVLLDEREPQVRTVPSLPGEVHQTDDAEAVHPKGTGMAPHQQSTVAPPTMHPSFHPQFQPAPPPPIQQVDHKKRKSRKKEKKKKHAHRRSHSTSSSSESDRGEDIRNPLSLDFLAALAGLSPDPAHQNPMMKGDPKSREANQVASLFGALLRQHHPEEDRDIQTTPSDVDIHKQQRAARLAAQWERHQQAAHSEFVEAQAGFLTKLHTTPRPLTADSTAPDQLDTNTAQPFIQPAYGDMAYMHLYVDNMRLQEELSHHKHKIKQKEEAMLEDELLAQIIHLNRLQESEVSSSVGSEEQDDASSPELEKGRRPPPAITPPTPTHPTVQAVTIQDVMQDYQQPRSPLWRPQARTTPPNHFIQSKQPEPPPATAGHSQSLTPELQQQSQLRTITPSTDPPTGRSDSNSWWVRSEAVRKSPVGSEIAL